MQYPEIDAFFDWFNNQLNERVAQLRDHGVPESRIAELVRDEGLSTPGLSPADWSAIEESLLVRATIPAAVRYFWSAHEFGRLKYGVPDWLLVDSTEQMKSNRGFQIQTATEIRTYFSLAYDMDDYSDSGVYCLALDEDLPDDPMVYYSAGSAFEGVFNVPFPVVASFSAFVSLIGYLPEACLSFSEEELAELRAKEPQVFGGTAWHWWRKKIERPNG